MLTDDLKEIRENALMSIADYNARLGNLAKEKRELKPSSQQEKLECEIMVEEAKYRGAMLDEYCKLVSNKENGLDINIGYRLVYNKMQEELNSIADSLFQSFARLKNLYEYLEIIAPVSETGLEYFKGKFNEEYKFNTDMWKKTYELRLLVEKLDAEVNQSSENNSSCEDEDCCFNH